MYATAFADVGKLVVYDLDKNKVIWQKNIGHGVEHNPVYESNNIIANSADGYWFEIDYKGKFISSKSKTNTYIDDEKVSAKSYEFLTHDGKEIDKDFLKKNKISDSDYVLEKSKNQTFILDEKHLTVLEKKGRKKHQFDLETLFTDEEQDFGALSAIIKTDSENIWLVYQNHLIQYDFKNDKLLRNIHLNKWSPHQLVMDGRTIWLISKNDGQLYALDFELDKKIADYIKAKADMEREIRNPKPPDKKKIEAAKAAEEKFKNKN